MNIFISDIVSAKNPVRTSQDEEKMSELVNSIKEQGLIVPIKVRPIEEGYEVVYGHRRFEACKRLGFAEIDCIVEGVEENDQHIYALIENMVREDMNAYDIANGLRDLKKQTGWSNRKIADAFGWSSESTVANYLQMLREEVEDVIKEHSGVLSHHHFMSARNINLRNDEIANILDKSAKEKLNPMQTHKVSKAYSQAETPEEKQAILETPVENPMFERMVRAKARAEIERKAETAERHMGNTQEVKPFLDAIKAFEKAIDVVIESIEFNKFSPEAIQYTENRLEKLSEKINDLHIKLLEAK